MISSRFRSIVRASAVTLAVSLFVPAFAHADAKDDVQSAVQKLADAKSYSWASTVEGQMGGSGSGKAEKEGYTTVTMTARDTSIDAVIKGDKAVIKTDDGWKTSAEMADAQGAQRYMAGMVRNYKAPAQLLGDMLQQLKELKKGDDGSYSADLDEATVKKLMAIRRRPNTNGDANAGPQVSNASGSVKFFVTDGTVSKSVLHVTGTVSFNGNDRDIDRTTTTEFKDVDKTTVDVPAEAKAKLDTPAK